MPDGAGGYDVLWKEGAKFLNYLTLEQSNEVRIAEANGYTSIYRGRVKKALPLKYGDVIKDYSLGATYRVTSNPDENVAPSMSTFDLKEFTAERWALTS